MAFIVNLLKLPVFLDSVGTVFMGALFGPLAGALTGIVSNIAGGLIINPVYYWFIVTAAAIGALAGVIARRIDFRASWKVAVAGAATGLIAAMLSAPIATYVFGGVTPAGSYSVIVAFAKASGATLMKSAVFAGLASDPVDKALSFLLAASIFQALPPAVRTRLGWRGAEADRA